MINSAGFYGTKAPIGEITAAGKRIVRSSSGHSDPGWNIGKSPADDCDADMMDVFQTNSLGPLLVTQALLPLLRKYSPAIHTANHSTLPPISDALRHSVPSSKQLIAMALVFYVSEVPSVRKL